MWKKKRNIGISLLMMGVLMISSVGCGKEVEADNLMEGIRPQSVEVKEPDEWVTDGYMDLAVDLFRTSATETEDGNVLISPLSVSIALAMTANGAAGKTGAEMQRLFGGEGSMEEINNFFYLCLSSLPSNETNQLKVANSIWFRDDESILKVIPDFLQTNANYYGAQIYKSPFDKRTKSDMNRWVDRETNGMVKEIVDQVEADDVMYLINALMFDAQWHTPYEKTDVYAGSFACADGNSRTVDMLHGEENVYLFDDEAVGFMKPYKDHQYNFLAILPRENIGIEAYVENFTGEKLRNLLKNYRMGTVQTTMPKFSCTYEKSMKKTLKELGMVAAFDPVAADFSQMAQSGSGNLYISDILHKTYISVNELGTRAGAVTSVEMKNSSSAMAEWTVTLDRPFLYLILDRTADLPIFIGVVKEV